MPETLTIPTQAATDLPTFKVLVDGEDIGGQYGLISIMVSKAVNKIPKARIMLADGSVALEDFENSSGDVFVPGKEVEVKGGYHNIEDTIFKGVIIKHGIKTLENKTPLLVIDLRDNAVKMTVGRKNKYFEEVKDSDIIEELAGAYGLQTDVESTSVTHKEMVQYYVTDWDFVVSRAEVNGLLVFADDGQLAVKAPDLSQEPIVNLGYGHNIMEFEAAMDARDQLAASTSKSWDYSKQEMIEEEGEDPGLDEQGDFTTSDLSDVLGVETLLQQHTGKVEDTELKAWADAKLLKSRLAKVKGRVKIVGFSDVKPGHVINLEGLGGRFNGPAFVSSVVHDIAAGSTWFTHLEFGLDQEWFADKYNDIIAKPAGGLLPPVHGLQVGIVTNIHEDPDGEFRIRVRLPVVDPEHDGVWARMVSPDAGDSRGMVFRPEVEDEVIVGFLNDDPRDPIILGMLHSSAKPSPIDPEEENNEKGFVTRGELKLTFNDDKLSITLETPNGNKLLLSDDEGGIQFEDENGNKVTLSSDGVVIESAKDLNLKASGDVNIEGTNVTVKANASFKAEGSAGAEISSSAQTVVKGSIVQIN
ncbi:MAG: type VI secretion system tip protein VgrG [Flavobacteriales bacterium]|nr:type VI secretion system tip protein VgrG [Flavobacteriales bacterium]MCB9448599.1 type VI secretion system tip protein VgrG [Flavobacteriales bacterium]